MNKATTKPKRARNGVGSGELVSWPATKAGAAEFYAVMELIAGVVDAPSPGHCMLAARRIIRLVRQNARAS